MTNDPIVEEVRRVRDTLARQFNYDIHAIFADLRAGEQRDNPAHPLVKDASEWVASAENLHAVREKPNR